MFWLLLREEQPLYVFGTMHVQDERAFQNLKPVYDAIDNCECFASELDLNNSHQGLSPQLLPESRWSLKTHLKPAEYAKAQRILLRSTGINLDALPAFPPLLIMGMIQAQMLGQMQNVPLDQHLWNYARQQDIDTTGIETATEQQNELLRHPPKRQAKTLEAFIRSLPQARKRVIKMAEYYAKDQLPMLHHVGKKSAGKLRQTILYDRNIVMANRIHTMAQDKRLFAAIGAGHLWGGKGVLRLLKHKGWKPKYIARS